PEAIKLAPVIAALRSAGGVRVCLVSVAQHRELLDQALQMFDLVPDHDLDLMRERQELSALAGRVLTAVDPILADERPDIVIVQGDTTSALAVGLAAAYRRLPVAHVEAGLRS